MSVNSAFMPQSDWTPAPPKSAMPAEPTPHTAFWRTTAWSPWKPIVAVVLVAVVFAVVQVLVLVSAVIIDAATGRIDLNTYLQELSEGTLTVTPAYFLANNLGLAAMIPLAFLINRWPFGQRAGWLNSVIGRLRWRWLLSYAAVISLPWLGLSAWELWAGRADLAINPDTWVLVVGIVLTTPFQAAGEEYLLRGAMLRTVASFFTRPLVGFITGAVVSSGLFMLLHGAGDLTLNLYYFFVGAVTSWLVWRTGGLEAAIAMHVVNNLTSEMALPFIDISSMFDRQQGVASFADVAPAAVCMILAVIVAEVMVRRQRLTVKGPVGAPVTLES